MISETERDLLEQLRALEQGAEGREFTDDERDQWNVANQAIDEYRTRRQRLDELAGRPENTEHGSVYEPALTRGYRGDEQAPEHIRSAHTGALRAVDQHSGALSAQANDRLDQLIRTSDPTGVDSRYISAVASVDYQAAFGKLLAHPQDAHVRMTPREADAVRLVTEVMSQRALAEGAGPTGGYGVPYTLDPSIVLSSNGSINPVRQLARTATISSSNQWLGVSSDGVVAHWYPEAGEVTDDAPTLAQPTVTVRRASAFVPFSIEVGEDYVGLQQELARLISDAKDQLEAQAFIDGLAANNAPVGILATTGGLPTTSRIQTAVAATFAIADNYLLKAGLPARFIGAATIVANPATFDVIYRQAGGGSTEPQLMPDRGGEWIGIPAREWSNVATGTTTATKTAILADWKNAYIVVDRVGMSIEVIPHLLGANRRPSGQRGVFAYWRVGAAPLVANAARYLEIR